MFKSYFSKTIKCSDEKNITRPHLFLFSLIPTNASSQNIALKGKVTEAKTGEAMVGVHITVVGDVYGTVSDMMAVLY